MAVARLEFIFLIPIFESIAVIPAKKADAKAYIIHIIISIPSPCVGTNKIKIISYPQGNGMIRDYFAHSRFAFQMRKFRLCNLIRRRLNGKGTFTLKHLLGLLFHIILISYMFFSPIKTYFHNFITALDYFTLFPHHLLYIP